MPELTELIPAIFTPNFFAISSAAVRAFSMAASYACRSYFSGS
jgi:hypothetical protein